MTPQEASARAREICRAAPVVPVIVINRVADAIPMAKALVAGGLPALEVTLRTPVALEAIKAMSTVAGGIVGAGTVVTPDDAATAKQAGAKFAVSPGSTARLLSACEDIDLPMLPGAATASEAMALLERGYDMLKFFPAEASGGAAALKGIGAPLPQISFCPTGGVSSKNAPTYLGLPNVVCVGGSWVVPADLVAAGDWNGITALARAAASLG